MVFLCSNSCTSEEIVCVSFVFSIHASYTYGLGFGKMIKTEKKMARKPFSRNDSRFTTSILWNQR